MDQSPSLPSERKSGNECETLSRCVDATPRNVHLSLRRENGRIALVQHAAVLRATAFGVQH
eukprot:6207105-Pleurochrysis_carterae.AAC.3